MTKPRLKEQYFDYGKYIVAYNTNLRNVMCAPKLVKVTLNISTKEILTNNKLPEALFRDVFIITGQRPVFSVAKKSISNFKLKTGVCIGVKVTLRRNVMYEFIDRLVNIALPRSRNFRGLNSKQFDGAGNYSFTLKEQTIFPEVECNKVDSISSVGVVLVTSSKCDSHAKKLLESFNLPFIE